MKRPEGFDEPRKRPVRPTPPAPPVQRPQTPPPAPAPVATPTDTGPVLDPRQAETERIEPLPQQRSNTSDPHEDAAPSSVRRPASLGRTTTPPAASSSAQGKPPRARREPRPPRPPRVVDEESAERKRIRKAARARKRFERNERRRFTRNTRRRRAAWLTLAGIVAVLGIVFAIAVYSPLLALRTITVEGASGSLTAAEVEAKVDGQLGTPLALVDFSRIRSELGEFPLIRSYVTETIPPGTIVIHVVVRTPVAAVKNGSTYSLIDPAGVEVSAATSRGKLPVLTVDDQATNGPAFRSAIQVLLTAPDSILKNVTSVKATTADDVTLTFKGGGPRVVWGASDDAALKARVAGVLLKQPNCQAEKIIDVSAPSAPICGPK